MIDVGWSIEVPGSTSCEMMSGVEQSWTSVYSTVRSAMVACPVLSRGMIWSASGVKLGGSLSMMWTQ